MANWAQTGSMMDDGIAGTGTLLILKASRPSRMIEHFVPHAERPCHVPLGASS